MIKSRIYKIKSKRMGIQGDGHKQGELSANCDPAKSDFPAPPSEFQQG